MIKEKKEKIKQKSLERITLVARVTSKIKNLTVFQMIMKFSRLLLKTFNENYVTNDEVCEKLCEIREK